MESELLKKLTSESELANKTIERLKSKIEQLKSLQKENGNQSENDVIRNLQQENKKLKEEIEELKKELLSLDKQNPSTVVNTTAAAAVVAPVTESKPVEQPKQQKAKGSDEQKEKKQKEKKQPTNNAQPAAPAEPVVVDVSKLDIRVGKIIKCEKHPEADALYVEQIDLGEDKPRTVCSGLVKFIPLEEMQNRLVLLLCNLKPAKLRGVASEAMVLCASTPEKVELLNPPENASIGDRVTVAGYDGVPEKEINQKNNIFAIVQPDLKTNDDLVATYKGVPLEIKSKGVIKAPTLKNVPIK